MNKRDIFLVIVIAAVVGVVSSLVTSNVMKGPPTIGYKMSEVYDPAQDFFEFGVPKGLSHLIGGMAYEIEVTDNPGTSLDNTVCIRINNAQSQQCGIGQNEFHQLDGLLIYTNEIFNPDGNGICTPHSCFASLVVLGTTS